jgi:hypothetical protein
MSTATPTMPAATIFNGTLALPPEDGAFSWPPPAPYTNIVKDLGRCADATQCLARCAAYSNHGVSPLSGWTRCESFVHTADSRCYAIVDANEWWPRHKAGATSGRLHWPPAHCLSDADCSFNGVCHERPDKNRTCACDAAWRGDRCQTLALLPTGRASGLRGVDAVGRNVSSWGGAVLLDEASGEFHMWASEMLFNCGIDSWTSNSHIVHASSTDGVHFSRGEQLWPAFSHEPTVARAPTGEWVMWFTSGPSGPGGKAAPTPCKQCADGHTLENSTCPGGPAGSGPTFMSWAPAPRGPWSTPQRLFASQANETASLDTNLAMAILSNGSAVGIGRQDGARLVVAGHWKNASSYVGHWSTRLFPDRRLVPPFGLEDPFVYTDRSGRFHAVFHSQIEKDDQRICGGHAYSVDGWNWTFTGTAWSNAVEFRHTDREQAASAVMPPVPLHEQTSNQHGGERGASPPASSAYSTYRFSRRERPHLLFGSLTEPRKITALTSGVQYGPDSPVYHQGQDACYTLLQPVAV